MTDGLESGNLLTRRGFIESRISIGGQNRDRKENVSTEHDQLMLFCESVLIKYPPKNVRCYILFAYRLIDNSEQEF